MKTLFTKGPWLMNTTKRFINNKGLAITDDKYKLICEVSHDLSELDIKEYEANAKLITYAPEMFNLIYEMTDYLEGVDSNNNVVIRMPISLSKRIGEALMKITE